VKAGGIEGCLVKIGNKFCSQRLMFQAGIPGARRAMSYSADGSSFREFASASRQPPAHERLKQSIDKKAN
jgi:hypothetical protein